MILFQELNFTIVSDVVQVSVILELGIWYLEENIIKSAMYKIYQVFLVSLCLLPLHIDSISASPSVELVVDYPKDIGESILVGELCGRIQRIWLKAKANEENVEFTWAYQGPGELEEFAGMKNTRVYKLPDKIEGESVKVSVTVTVHNNKGEKATDNVTFVLFSVPIQIHQVLLKKEGGIIIRPIYSVKSGERVTVDVDIAIPSNRNIRIECGATLGKVEYRQQKIIYIAPEKPGEADILDILTVRAIDNDTGEITAQETVNIAVRDF